MKLSARNQLDGTIDAIDVGVVTATVKIRLPGGEVITASITREAAEDLGLAVGGSVKAVIKSSDVMVATT